ncbi:hypothetical protein [Amycolatopsis jejuensis]|uniref:hypothetical protein n=1 Tax=Amycolatopsis jejuensis TaxID=330084 RepID=UPI000525CB1B|nr:hypothetical protein [Amycolatopsis jejuensis]
MLGALIAGLEHRRWWSAALRGAIGGLAAAGVVVLLHAAIPGVDAADFDPAAFPVYAAAASAALHAGGSLLRRRSLF